MSHNWVVVEKPNMNQSYTYFRCSKCHILKAVDGHMRDRYWHTASFDLYKNREGRRGTHFATFDSWEESAIRKAWSKSGIKLPRPRSIIDIAPIPESCEEVIMNEALG